VSYHFVGLAGIGMSALAQLVRARGHAASGSDRFFDRGQLPERRAKLAAQGVRIVPQDGSGVRPGLKHLVLSSAIEADNPDCVQARRLRLTPIHRSALLASLFHECGRRVAVTGSYGKTTITAMIGWGLVAAGHRPMVVAGGVMRNFETERALGNAVPGAGEIACIEADESDGTCVNYRPTLGVITGFARDHKEVAELQSLYSAFGEHTSGHLVLSMGAAASLFSLRGPRRVTFGLRDGDVRARQVRFSAREITFSVGRSRFRLRQIGPFSVFNALAAIAALRLLGLSDLQIARGLRTFEGVARHMEPIGRTRGIRVFDDLAHNPSKIAAAAEAARHAGAKRVLLVFQPHGYGPARFMRRELGETFKRILSESDRAYLLPIYYVGGTAQADISSEDLAADARAAGAQVEALPDRATLLDRLAREAHEEDAIIVMGARDESLTSLARSIVERLGPQSPGALDRPERMA